MQGGFTEKTELKVLGRATGVHGGVKDKGKKKNQEADLAAAARMESPRGPEAIPIFLDLDARRQNDITFEPYRVVWIPAGRFESTYRFRTYMISRNVPRTYGGRLKRIPTCIVLKSG